MDDLREALWMVADDTAVAFGFSFEPGCQQHLRGFLDAGANAIESEGLSPERMSLAKFNTVLFVTSMVAEARRTGLLELHEPTFFAVRDRLCPIWPFC